MIIVPATFFYFFAGLLSYSLGVIATVNIQSWIYVVAKKYPSNYVVEFSKSRKFLGVFGIRKLSDKELSIPLYLADRRIVRGIAYLGSGCSFFMLVLIRNSMPAKAIFAGLYVLIFIVELQIANKYFASFKRFCETNYRVNLK